MKLFETKNKDAANEFKIPEKFWMETSKLLFGDLKLEADRVRAIVIQVDKTEMIGYGVSFRNEKDWLVASTALAMKGFESEEDKK